MILIIDNDDDGDNDDDDDNDDNDDDDDNDDNDDNDDDDDDDDDDIPVPSPLAASTSSINDFISFLMVGISTDNKPN